MNDGQLSIDNNHAERVNKAFVIGRKNCLFAKLKTARRQARASIALSKQKIKRANAF
ncbi:IS66 family transposase [Psychromonas ossibalaenae]|uniref:IS66 family transposase n=1 Tax=Psychromonas ossibalaenae TaxID=444922 RepID=UPI0009FD1B4D